MDKKSLINFLRSENEYITDLLLTHNVPESIEDDNYEEYLITHNEEFEKNESQNLPWKSVPSATSLDELEERLNTIKNKMTSKKGPSSERSRQRKKLKKNKELKKVLVSAAKSFKNEKTKQMNNIVKDEENDHKPIVESTPHTSFNKEGKILFSKIEFPHKQKKSHKNPRDVLKQLKKTDRELNELKEKGEIQKIAHIKSELSWKKAFDKVEGKKIKDDPNLLYKTLKKRKLEKKKSKKDWQERKEKLEQDLTSKQKKRQENINKRIKEKQKRKLKKAAKRGRITSGF